MDNFLYRDIVIIDVSKKNGVKLTNSNPIFDKPIGYIEQNNILRDIFVGFGRAYNNN